jgi:hypothetical protein
VFAFLFPWKERSAFSRALRSLLFGRFFSPVDNCFHMNTVAEIGAARLPPLVSNWPSTKSDDTRCICDFPCLFGFGVFEFSHCGFLDAATYLPDSNSFQAANCAGIRMNRYLAVSLSLDLARVPYTG